MAFSAKLKKIVTPRCSAVVVAAGSSVRMGRDKLTLPLRGVSVLVRTLQALDGCSCISEIVVVTREDRLEEIAALCHSAGVSKVRSVVKGGKTRTESALAGLLAIDSRSRYVLIHDGARPLVTEATVEAVLRSAAAYRNACPAVPVTDTVKRCEGDVVVETPERSSLRAVQTPQGFLTDLVKTALTKAVAAGKEYTDDCAAVEALGVPTHICQGNAENIKITAPQDIELAELILQRREAET